MKCHPILLISYLSLIFFIAQNVSAHESIHHQGNPRGIESVDFKAKHISRVVTAGYPVTFGIYAFTHREPTTYITVKDDKNIEHKCIKTNFLAFDVDDSFAFDIDENIRVEFLIDRSQTSSLVYGYDQHGSAKANALVDFGGVKKGLLWSTVTFERARFVNRGMSNTDFAITTNETMFYEDELEKDASTSLVLCDLKISRDKSKHQAKALAKTLVKSSVKTTAIKKVNFSFTDENKNTPVRVGLYNSSGSAVLLDDVSLPLPYYEDKSQQLSLTSYPPYQYWPHDNRYFYYIDGQFTKDLSIGTYTLISSKGPEYRLNKQIFNVTANSGTVNINTKMKRWMNLPALGWYSGDVHIHIKREQKDNQNLAAILSAEDVHFSNLLEMSTHKSNHFEQYAFGKKGTFVKNDFAIIPGIEGPRTAHRGHAIALNVKETFKQKDSFFLYNKHFNYYQQQGALIGYAHVGSKEFNASWGLALDMPFGLIDFVEIMQNQRLRAEFWYDFLNLGFKLSPAAGSDYPYFEQPGAVRSYVKMPVTKGVDNKNFNTDDWYKYLQKGNTFVSNAPLIELQVDGQAIGTTITLKPEHRLKITANASINSDYDRLKELELVHCGEVIKQIKAPAHGVSQLSFEHEVTTKSSGWLALRAKGENYAIAHTGAIYLADEHGSSVCKKQAPAVIKSMLARLDALENTQLNINKELEYWEATGLDKAFNQQQPLLNKQIAEARAYYLALKMRF